VSYPQNPGQGQNQQFPYGQQPSGPQQMPGQPFSGPQQVPGQQPVPGQPMPAQYPGAQYGQPYPAYPGGPGQLQQKPGGGTAITAAVLAILGGIFALIGVVGSIVGMSAFHGVFVILIVSLIVDAALAVLLLYGAIALIMHKPLGRMLVIIGCSVTIAFDVISVILNAVGTASLGASSEFLGAGIGVTIVMLLPPIATLILAIVNPTKQWVGLGATPAAPQYPGGYPQQPQGW
jgi:hypothetical protein